MSNEPDGVEGGLRMLVHALAAPGHLPGLAHEGHDEDVEPAAEEENEAQTGPDDRGLAAVAAGQHRHGADQEPPEHPRRDDRLHRQVGQGEHAVQIGDILHCDIITYVGWWEVDAIGVRECPPPFFFFTLDISAN